MHSKSLSRVIQLLAIVGAAGCATVKPQGDYDRVSQFVEQSTGKKITVDPETLDEVHETPELLLGDGLTADEAVQLALINNPRLQAALLAVGIGRADVVQSGLFSNPGLALSLRFPDEGGLANFEVSLAQNIAELWQVRPRVRAAERDLDQTILLIAREAHIAAADAGTAYIRAVQTERQFEISCENLTIAGQLSEAASARRDAGSGTDVDVNLARAERASLDVASRSKLVAAIEAKTNLSKILGITTSPEELRLVDALPDVGELGFAPTELAEAAIADRLDLKAADAVIEAAGARLEQERAKFAKTVELGISAEREARRSRGGRNWFAETASASAESGAIALPSLWPREGQSTDYVTGPTLSVELPLFDQNQAQIARAEYELLQAKLLREAIVREIRQESWLVHARAKAAFESATFLRDELLPLRETGLRLARESYRAGGTTLLTVLDAQRRLLEARAENVDARAAAGMAKFDLERIGGRPFDELRALTAQSHSTEGQP